MRAARRFREAHRKTKPPNRLGLAALTKTDAEIIPGSSNRPRDACAGVLAGNPTALHRELPSPKRESPVRVRCRHRNAVFLAMLLDDLARTYNGH